MEDVQKLPLGELFFVDCRDLVLSDKQRNDVLTRHTSGDWGDISDADRKLNDIALREGGHILSCYEVFDDGTRVWVYTNAARTATLILEFETYPLMENFPPKEP